MKEGTKVKLKDSVNHICPEGRDDNQWSYVIAILDEGGVMVAPELEGCKYWNKDDLDVVE